MTTKDLDYFIAHPDEMPTDESSLEALLDGQGVAATTEQDVKPAPSGEVETEQEQTGETPEAGTEATTETAETAELGEDGKPVLTRDGKHALPYSVLKSERERRQAAEQMLQDLKSQVEELQQARASGAAVSSEVSEGSIISPEDLEALREDFPAFAAVLDQLTGKIGTLQSQIGQFTEREAQEQERQAQVNAGKVRDTVQTNIDGNPVLSYFQAEKPKMFEIAIAYDNQAKKDPRFKGMDMAQRFDKVVELIEADYGKTQLPEGYTKQQAEPQLSAEELAAKAKDALKNAGTFKPRTLSDLPGGIPPASSEPENLDRMSVGDLSAMMDKMSATQINELIAKIG